MKVLNGIAILGFLWLARLAATDFFSIRDSRNNAAYINSLFSNTRRMEAIAPTAILRYYNSEQGGFRGVMGMQKAYIDSVKSWNPDINFGNNSYIPYSATGKSMIFPDLDGDGYVGYLEGRPSK